MTETSAPSPCDRPPVFTSPESSSPGPASNVPRTWPGPALTLPSVASAYIRLQGSGWKITHSKYRYHSGPSRPSSKYLLAIGGGGQGNNDSGHWQCWMDCSAVDIITSSQNNWQAHTKHHHHTHHHFRTQVKKTPIKFAITIASRSILFSNLALSPRA
jgi:hypothetical protein